MNRLTKTFLQATLAAATAFPAHAQDMRKIGAPGTIPAIGSDQRDQGNGKVSFTVNANEYEWPWTWPSFLRSTYTAIVFTGKADENRECPYYSSADRPRTLKHLSRLTYRVETAATPPEIAKVKEAGCIITESPSLRELGFESKKNDAPAFNGS